jgi:uncharacterized membrane protein
MKKKSHLQFIILWCIAILFTLTASIYQRKTGPTYPLEGSFSIKNKMYTYSLPRSGEEQDCLIELKNWPKNEETILYWQEYPASSIHSFTSVKMQWKENTCFALLPQQPAAGKLAYYIEIKDMDFRTPTALIRFKNGVHWSILIPHIVLMFASMLTGVMTLLLVFANDIRYKNFLKHTFWILLVGGFIFGPLVQKQAFDAFWTGFPFGFDLTDNKTLIAFIGVALAYYTRQFTWNKWIAVIAILILFTIFTIPHSLGGSELNRKTGKIESNL